MIRIGYAPGAFDLFHIGHFNLLRQAKERCDFLIAGVAADAVLVQHKGVTPVVPLAERLEIVRNIRLVDAAAPAMTNDKVEIWKDLRFNLLFKGNDWQGTEKGNQLEREFAALGVKVAYFPYCPDTSSSALSCTLQNIDEFASRSRQWPSQEHGASGLRRDAVADIKKRRRTAGGPAGGNRVALPGILLDHWITRSFTPVSAAGNRT